ncbi:MAG: hypothetical protein IKZ98_13545 [Clostridia bacterium]|nr:hypothetical protein [Clostridia bacterium]
MELICTRCSQLVETQTCPHCGSAETRVPEGDDYCKLAEVTGSMAVVLEGALAKKGIPYRMHTTTMDKVYMFRSFYVPYSRIDDAYITLHELWGDEPPVLDENELFAPEEIDGMDVSQVEDLSLEELTAYKDKIMKTLKAIKYQEQQWKQRSNLLLDMKEEVENLIEDLS